MSPYLGLITLPLSCELHSVHALAPWGGRFIYKSNEILWPGAETPVATLLLPPRREVNINHTYRIAVKDGHPNETDKWVPAITPPLTGYSGYISTVCEYRLFIFHLYTIYL